MNNEKFALDQLLGAYLAEFQPTTAHQRFLVEQLAASRWRIERAHRLEAVALDHIVTGEIDETNPNARILATLGPNPLSVLHRWAAAAERSYYRAHRELAAARRPALQNEPNHLELERIQQSAAPASLPPTPVQNEPNRSPRMPRHITRRERKRLRALAAA